MDIYLKLFEVLFPVFCIVCIGLFLGKKNPNFDTSFITTYAGNFGTPALVIFALTAGGVTFDVFKEFFIYAIILLTSFGIVGLIFLTLMKKDYIRELPTFILPNTGNMGIPICLFAYGELGMGMAAAISSLVVLLHFTLNIFLAKILRIRVIRSIQDIYPESLSSQKRLNQQSLFYRLLQIVERYNYSNSSVNITISRMMGLILTDRYPELPSPIIIPNWHTISNQSEDVLKNTEISSILGHEDLIFLYGGNISTASNIIGLVRAFTLFSLDKPNIKLVVAGSGPLLKSCMHMVKKLNAEDRVCFHSPWASEDTLPLLNIADVLVLPTDNEQAKYSVPSKIISYMTARRPILSFGAMDSELAKCVIESGGGWFFDGVDQEKMQHGLEEASISKTNERQVMGLKGYDFMIDNFSRDVNLQKIINQLIEEN